jgi:hypothetical protein
MAGMAYGGARRGAGGSPGQYPGQTYNPQIGGYQPTATRLSTDASGAVVDNPNPPTTMVSTASNPNVQHFDQNVQYYNPGQAFTNGAAPSGGTGPRSTRNTGMPIDGLLAQIKSQQFIPSRPPAAQPARTGGQYDEAAERAAYGGAKESTGLAMQSALKGLSAQMAQRGIRGSTIERGGLEQIFSGGLSDLAGTDRQIAEKRSNRAFDAENMDLARNENARQFDTDFYQTEAQREQSATSDKLQLLLRAYGLAY